MDEKWAYRRSAISLTAHFDPGPKAHNDALDGDVTRLFRTPSAAARAPRRIPRLAADAVHSGDFEPPCLRGGGNGGATATTLASSYSAASLPPRSVPERRLGNRGTVFPQATAPAAAGMSTGPVACGAAQR